MNEDSEVEVEEEEEEEIEVLIQQKKFISDRLNWSGFCDSN